MTKYINRTTIRLYPFLTTEETRDFTFVEDVVDGTLQAAVTPEVVGEAFNLAAETETRVIDIANTINEVTDVPLSKKQKEF